MINKEVKSALEACQGIKSGMTLMLGGFGLCGIPENCISALVEMKVNDLRQLCKITHIIDGKPKNYMGYCFSCLTPLKPDYTRFENYCLDC